ILNRDGKIIAMYVGGMNWDAPEVITAFGSLLDETEQISEKETTAAGLGYNTVAEKNDSERFASEYPLVGKGNVFVFRNAHETADILLHGTGIVFMGFKECPWCQQYAVFLNDTAHKMGIKKIYYCDINEDRQNNTESYRKIVKILSGSLQYDDEGRLRVFVPDLTIIKNGRIITRDFETSKDTLGYDSPREYWTEERVQALKNRLTEGMKQINNNCNTCN
ncbi:MAG: hypothetical protein FWF29_08155, partial [Treponema sp.]|nr:hypothetical protein [Treponema sp.]